MADPSFVIKCIFILIFTVIFTVGLHGCWTFYCQFQNKRRMGRDKARAEAILEKWKSEFMEPLKAETKRELLHQHLATNHVLGALERHLIPSAESPRKPLVIIFSGPVGVGKTFLAEKLILKHFKKYYGRGAVLNKIGGQNLVKGTSSPEEIQRQKNQLRAEVEDTVRCHPHALFLFDEIWKMPDEILNELTSYMEYRNENAEGIDFRRTVFIFLTNMGSSQINSITHEMTVMADPIVSRTKLKLSHFSDRVKEAVLRGEGQLSKFECSRKFLTHFQLAGGGLQGTDLFDRALCDHIIPFLPLERSHVEQWIKRELRRRSQGPELCEKILRRDVDWMPDGFELYSLYGAKQLDTKVDTAIMRARDKEREE